MFMLVSIKINISLLFLKKNRLYKLTCYMILFKNFWLQGQKMQKYVSFPPKLELNLLELRAHPLINFKWSTSVSFDK